MSEETKIDEQTLHASLYKGIHVATKYVPYYAFVAPVYDFRSLADLQVIDERDDLWMVYKYNPGTKSFSQHEFYECPVEAQVEACQLHIKIATKMKKNRGMTFSKETKERISQAEDGRLIETARMSDEEGPNDCLYPWEIDEIEAETE